MGTHCAYYAIENGKHVRYERTMDGSMLMDEVEKWSNGEVGVNVSNMGNGSIEVNKECEHEECYFVLIDYDRKVVGLSFFISFEVHKVLHEQGWELCQMFDEGDYEHCIDTSELD